MHTTMPRLRAAFAVFCAAALLSAAASHAGEARSTKKKEKAQQVAPAKAHKGTRVKPEKSSGESTAERDRRLQRECKGRANAGACLGYGG